MKLFALAPTALLVGLTVASPLEARQSDAVCKDTMCIATHFCVVLPKTGKETCVAPCGGFAGIQCQENEQCIDDWRDDCDPKKGGADCSGLCVAKDVKTRQSDPVCKDTVCIATKVCVVLPETGKETCVAPCGGFAGIECQDANTICIDDFRDDCDPEKGGADCSGICVPSDSTA